MAENARLAGNRTFILVHRQELIKQTSRALAEQGIPHGIIAPGYPEIDLPIQIASVQTLVRRIDRYRVPEFIIIDECHHALAVSYQKIIAWAQGAYVLGVTATPQRLDGRGFAGTFQDMVIAPSVQWLIDQGWLSTPILYAPPVPDLDLSKVHTRMGDFVREELESAMDKPTITGNAVEHYRKLLPSSPPTVAFCVSVAHAQHVAEEFRRSGITAESIDGSLSDELRASILHRLDTGDTRVVTSCDLISEGFDLPKIACAILMRPTQSLSIYLQQVGRALRTSKDKTETYILDMVESWRRHGLVQEERDWSLDSGRKKRDKKDVAELISCPKCYSVFSPTLICPKCGHKFESKRLSGEGGRSVQEVDGELVRIDESTAKFIRSLEVKKAKTLEDLQDLARRNNYDADWAHRIHDARLKKMGIERINSREQSA